jgi:hypothetical protein
LLAIEQWTVPMPALNLINKSLPRLAVSREGAAEALGVSIQHIDDDDLANAALGALVEAAARRGMSHHYGDGGWPRSEPKVILRHPGSKVRIPRGTAYRRNVPSAEELTTLKVDKLRVGPHGHYYSPYGGIAGDGRQRYSLHAPDAAQLGLAWGEAEAKERLKAIAAMPPMTQLPLSNSDLAE